MIYDALVFGGIISNRVCLGWRLHITVFSLAPNERDLRNSGASIALPSAPSAMINISVSMYFVS
jgi:hypothetical protein